MKLWSDTELKEKLTTEHAFVERKSQNDKGGWLRTAVAFANSVPVDYPAVLFVGVNDDGTLEGIAEPQAKMSSLSDYLDSHAYPPIYTWPQTLVHDGKTCIAVIIPGSENKPHFAGQAYIRVGHESKPSNEAQFDRLITERNSKARKLLESKGKQVTIEYVRRAASMTVRNSSYMILADCNQFFVTLQVSKDDKTSRSFPLSSIEIASDERFGHLKLITDE